MTNTLAYYGTELINRLFTFRKMISKVSKCSTQKRQILDLAENAIEAQIDKDFVRPGSNVIKLFTIVINECS